MVGGGLAMIAQGPVMLAENAAPRPAIIAALHDELVNSEGLTLRVNPPVDPIAPEAAEIPPGFSPVPGSDYETFLIDLAPEMEDLRAALNGKWRSDLRRGERSDVTITRSTKREDFEAFQPLLDRLADRKGFNVPQDARFFADVAEGAHPPENITIHLARHGDEIIGGHVGAFSGNLAVYLIGAVNTAGRDLRASFLLQWAVIEYARERGMRWYDLGGADQEENPHVFRFKKRMGGIHYAGPPIAEAKAPFPRGQLLALAEKAYLKVRG
ncbi:MAG: GNAT family N-acetyltransferase [Erythrobacter sp.]